MDPHILFLSIRSCVDGLEPNLLCKTQDLHIRASQVLQEACKCTQVHLWVLIYWHISRFASVYIKFTFILASCKDFWHAQWNAFIMFSECFFFFNLVNKINIGIGISCPVVHAYENSHQFAFVEAFWKQCTEFSSWNCWHVLQTPLLQPGSQRVYALSSWKDGL